MNKTISPEVAADLTAVIDHISTGKPLDEALVKRVTERSNRAQEELVRRFGIREIAVDLIREGREE